MLVVKMGSFRLTLLCFGPYQGIGRFSPMLDASFIGDLLQALNKLLLDDTLSTRVRLHAVKTGCMILSGPGNGPHKPQ